VRLDPIKERIRHRSRGIAVLILLRQPQEALVLVGSVLVEQTLGDREGAVALETHGYLAE